MHTKGRYQANRIAVTETQLQPGDHVGVSPPVGQIRPAETHRQQKPRRLEPQRQVLVERPSPTAGPPLRQP